MIWDAFFAETWRALRNRALIFWSVLAVPLGFVAGGALFLHLTKARGDEMAAKLGIPDLAASAVNLADAVMMGASRGANGAALVFMLIAAATVYAGDYRWETWRLITPRNDRISLILGKVGTMKVLAVCAMLVFLAASVVFHLMQAGFNGRALTFEMATADWGRAGTVWLLSYVRIVQYGLIALLVAVMTRSLMAALFAPIAIGFGHSILGSPMGLSLLKLDPQGWGANLLLPGQAYDNLKAAVLSGTAPVAPQAPDWIPALAGLTVWTLAPLALALLLFQRQDLSKE